MERFLGLVGLATLFAAVAFAGYQYREIHLPEFEDLKNTVEYQQCISDCLTTCRANSIPPEKCRCDHCNVHRRAN